MPLLSTYNVNRSPFSVPSDLKVLSAEGVGAHGDSVRTSKTVLTRSRKLPSSKAGFSSATPTTASELVEEERQFIIRKFSDLSHAKPQDLKRVVRLCQLHLAIGNSVPGLMPLVDAYRDQQSPDHVYCIYPALPSTLAEVIYSRTHLKLDQGAAITRELTRSLEKLHSYGLILGDLRPDWIKIEPTLSTEGCVSIANTTYVHFPSESVESVFGGNVDAPGDKPLLWYRPPELALGAVSKLTPAADMWTLGCLVAELFLRRPLFQCDSVAEYRRVVTDCLGSPPPEVLSTYNAAVQESLISLPKKQPVPMSCLLPGVPFEVAVLVQRLLVWSPSSRMTSKDLLKMPLLTSVGNPNVVSSSATPSPGNPVALPNAPKDARYNTNGQTAASDRKDQHHQILAADSANGQQLNIDDLKEQWDVANMTNVRDLFGVLSKQLDDCVSLY